MKNFWRGGVLALGVAQGALSQVQVQSPQIPDKAALAASGLEQQHALIQQQKALQETRFASDELACQVRFAVTDCVTDVRRRRREAMTDLNRQEQSLNNQQRKTKGGDQLIRLEDKAAQQSDRLAIQATTVAQSSVLDQAESPRFSWRLFG